MKRRLLMTFLIGMVFGVVLSLKALALLAGASSAEYTPEVMKVKISLGGYSARWGKPANSVHDPVRAEALVLKSGENMIAIVTMDIGGISTGLREKILEKLSGTGINDSNFLITATHSHSAPSGFSKHPDYYEFTINQAAKAIKSALANLKPATLRVGQKQVPGLTRNRRDPSYDYGTRRFDSSYDPKNPLNITDDTITVIRVDGQDGKPIALLVNFATHATVLGSDSFAVSADWPGAMKKRLESEFPGAVAMFMNGAQGDQEPVMLDVEPLSDLQYLERIGNDIAEAALPLVKDSQPVNAEPINSLIERNKVKAWVKLYNVPILKSALGKEYSEMPLMAMKAGDVVFMAIPLEAISKIGITLKKSAQGFGYKYPIVAGLANAHFGYCATPDEFARGGYEVNLTAFGKMEAGFVIGEMMLILRQMK